MTRARGSWSRARLAASALLLAVSAACAAPQRDRAQDTPEDFRMKFAEADEPKVLDHVTVEAGYVPVMWINADVESESRSIGSPDLDPGSGVTARAGLGTKEQNIGLLYLGTWHDENRAHVDATTQSLLLDFLYRSPLTSLGEEATFSLSIGLGMAQLAFDGPYYDDHTTGAVQMRTDVEYPVARPLTLSAGFAGFLWGQPGETVAYGTYFTVGAKLVF